MDPNEKNPNITTYRVTTETERLLHNRLLAEIENSKKLQSLVEDLKSQVDILQQQLKCLAENPKSDGTGAMETSSPRAAPRLEFSTDEDELARETEWIRTKSRKKRKLNTSPTQDETIKVEQVKPKKVIQPPPIIVDGIENYQNFHDFLAKHGKDNDFTIKMMSGDSVKVNAANDEVYRALTEALNIKKCLWHSYENKQDRPIRVMVKKLHHTCKPDRIMEDLGDKGFKILEAVNKLSWKTKAPLNMFMLTFANSEDINKIFKIQTVLGFKVEFQPLRTTKLVPQCKRCQAYGHTQRYCAKEPRCVKCTGKHLTKDCLKRADEKPKCIHCGAPHPANYRGCAIAKEIQLLRNKNTKKPNVVLHRSAPTGKQNGSADNHPNTTVPIHTSTKRVSYAQATAKNLTNNAPIPENQNKKLDDILNLMMSFDERLKKIENSTKTALKSKSK